MIRVSYFWVSPFWHIPEFIFIRKRIQWTETMKSHSVLHSSIKKGTFWTGRWPLHAFAFKNATLKRVQSFLHPPALHDYLFRLQPWTANWTRGPTGRLAPRPAARGAPSRGRRRSRCPPRTRAPPVGPKWNESTARPCRPAHSTDIRRKRYRE